MDKRSWPWKKKSSDKAGTATDTNQGDAQTDQDDSKTVKYVQVSVESYAHLTELEGQVKDLNAKISHLNDKLSSNQSEMTTKDNLVKQHSKVAEEAVSGWEKAEAEALALKHQLESVMLQKLTAEDRASHLDDALKECMKQVRNVKEESEQKLHDVIFAKTKQWENAKAQLEAKIMDVEQELRRSSAENAALSRSLQERSNLVMKISNEKSEAEAEIEVLKADIQSCEREINSLKYEIHVVSKELEIRNEEKNMSLRSTEVANKQHLEDIKKIAKLEAECQRLRGLVRKKLPGPAALAQMKLEVESLGREYGETRRRPSPARSSSPSPHHMSAPSDFSLESMHQCHKENEFLTARLLTMEEEMKMLKEALSTRNSELQESRNMCALTASKLRSVEAHLLVMNQQRSPTRSITNIHFEKQSNRTSLTSMSEDGIDEEGSCSESMATSLTSELSHIKKKKNVHKGNRAGSASNIELMDDFLEMEKLASESSVIPEGTTENVKTENDNEPGSSLSVPITLDSSNENDTPALDLKSRIASLFEQSHDVGRLLEGIHQIVQDMQEESPQRSVDCVVDESKSTAETCMEKECHEDTGEVDKKSSQPNAAPIMDQQLKNAISQILDLVSSIGKGQVDDDGKFGNNSGLREKIEDFSTLVNKILCDGVISYDFLVPLSFILSATAHFSSVMWSDKGNEGEIYISDCIDKVTLLENKVSPNNNVKDGFLGAGVPTSPDPEIEGALSQDFKGKCSLEEFEQLKLEKENIENDFARCRETLELTKLQVVETEAQLVQLKSQLAACENSNSLAETQLRCMAESYKTLETRKQELESVVSMLQKKEETLANELQEEKRSHQDDLVKYKELQEMIEGNSKCSTCSNSAEADAETKTKQEKELASTAEKLAECQETIFLLCKQLNVLRPAEQTSSSLINIEQVSNKTSEDEHSTNELVTSESMLSPQYSDQTEIGNVTNKKEITGGESPYNSQSHSETETSSVPASPFNSKRQKHRSPSASSMPNVASEKHGRGFSRFFSKGRSDH